MKRTLTLVSALALMLSMLALPAASEEAPPPTTTYYTGQGMTAEGPETEACDEDADTGQDKDFVIGDDGGYLKWVLTATDATYAKLIGPWGSFDMIKAGDGAWHKATDYYPLDELVPEKVYAEHDGTGNAQLVVSNGCPGDKPFVPAGAVEVTKTAKSSFDRTHDWSIDKSVETEEGFLLDGLPKIWLSIDGSGDEDATWNVDVTYEGFEDSGWKLEGEITAENTGNVGAQIRNWTDSQRPDAKIVNCRNDATNDDIMSVFNYVIPVGQSVTCDYLVDPADPTITENTATVGGWFVLDGAVDSLDEAVGSFSEQDTATYNWETPTNQINKVVTVTDTNDGFATAYPGDDAALDASQYSEGAVIPFEYSDRFAYTDYDDCGAFSVENTAKVIGDEEAVLDEDTALLKINVQCLVFDGETAWAANGDEPGELRYTDRGNWATYVEYAEKTTALFAGQTIPVGTVTFSAVADDEITILVTLTGDWEFEDVTENLKVQDYEEAPSGNPAPGDFDHKKDCDSEESTCSIVVPANNYYGVHVNVGQWIPDPEFGP